MTRYQVWKARERARFLFIATQARGRRVKRETGMTLEVMRLRSLANIYAGEVSALTYRMLRMDEAAGRPVKRGKRLDPWGVFTE